MLIKENTFYFSEADELTREIDTKVIKTDVVLDIGCGIAPINYFRPALHLMIEPWQEYADILSYRHQNDKSVIVIKTGALEALQQLQDNSVDSIFLIDVIEHMEKEVGFSVITEMERIARKQIIVFTPLGFMPQHIDNGEKDGWGLGGAEMQEHKSGWLPEDFSDDWNFYICKNYHDKNYNGERLEVIYGAFYAIRTFESKNIEVETPASFSEIRRPLPSELELERVTSHVQDLKQELEILSSRLNNISNELDRKCSELDNIKSKMLYKVVLKINNLFFKK
jgi:hypothetical protein